MGVKISQLPLGTAEQNAVVPSTNSDGTATSKIKIGDIASLAVQQFADFASFPATGDDRFIYLSKNDNVQYRWDGSTWQAVISSPHTIVADCIVPVGGSNVVETTTTPQRSPPAHSVIGGGANNTLSGYYGGAGNPNTIAGGSGNSAYGFMEGGCVIGGGVGNSTSDGYTVIGGGSANHVGGRFGTVGGGLQNTCSGYKSTVGGGWGNTAGGYASAVGGGQGNSTSGYRNFIGGGSGNTTSGYNSTISGGVGNAASEYGVVAGGSSNSATNYSAIGGGRSNNAEPAGVTGSNYYGPTFTPGECSTVGGGRLNTASGNIGYAVVGGGKRNTASGDYSTVSGGLESVADRHGMESFASGRFLTNGDAQRVDFVLRNITTNATPTTLFLDGSVIFGTEVFVAGSTRLTIPDGKALFATITIAGIINGGSKAVHYGRKVAIKRVADTASLIGTVSLVGADVEDDAAYDVAITADNTNKALQINVTGKAGETIRWVAHVEGVEIAYG